MQFALPGGADHMDSYSGSKYTSEKASLTKRRAEQKKKRNACATLH